MSFELGEGISLTYLILSHCDPQDLVRHYGSVAPAPTLEAAVREASTLVDEGDLLLSAHALALASTAMRQQPAVAGAATERMLPAAMQLVQSPLLQGAVLDGLQLFFNTLAGTTGDGTGVESQLLAVGATEVGVHKCCVCGACASRVHL